MTSGPQPKKARELRKARIEVATLALNAALDKLRDRAIAFGKSCTTNGPFSVASLHPLGLMGDAAIIVYAAHRELKAARR